MTLQTLADALGVSRTTASNAFNRPDQLNPALRERVLALAAELGYAGPDPAGRALRSGRAGSIGVLLTERLSYAFGDPAAVSTLRGLAIEAEQAGISLALLPVPLSGGEAAADAVNSALVDACFVYALAGGPRERQAGARAPDPGRRRRHPARPRGPVRHGRRPQRRTGGRAASARSRPPAARGRVAAAARGRSHRLRGPRPPRHRHLPRDARAPAGYADAITAAGIDWDEVPVYEGHPNSRTLGAEAIRALLALDPPPTALLAMSTRSRSAPSTARTPPAARCPGSSRSSASTMRPRRSRAT